MAKLQPSDLPDWVDAPPQFWKSLSNDSDLEPWYFLTRELSQLRQEGLKRRNARTLFAFAARRDCDDIACWEEKHPGKVMIIHDFASQDRAQRATFDSFDEWMRQVEIDHHEHESS
jgi:hypothetical protein